MTSSPAENDGLVQVPEGKPYWPGSRSGGVNWDRVDADLTVRAISGQSARRRRGDPIPRATVPGGRY